MGLPDLASPLDHGFGVALFLHRMGNPTMAGVGMIRFNVQTVKRGWGVSVALLLASFFGGTVLADEIVVVVGAEGTPEYGAEFGKAAANWQQLAEANEFECTVIGLENKDQSDRDRLVALLDGLAKIESDANLSEAPIWIVLIGHGTFADGEAKFNLRGMDFSATELAQWLSPIRRPLVVINGASSSGPFVNRLSKQNRIVVTGTKSSSEHNYTRFGVYFAEAIVSPEADLDHDDEVSVKEAFVLASRKVQAFYDGEGRIATEHALLDDNGDSAGTPVKIFLAEMNSGEVATKDQKKIDGDLARTVSVSPDGNVVQLTPPQRKLRDSLEAELEVLRGQRDQWDETQYLEKIFPIMVKLAKLYHEG